MPSMALSAMRTNRTAGSSRKTQPTVGNAAIAAPAATDRKAAASVTWLAVAPFAASMSTSGLSVDWNAGFSA
jgi:hypothetical protein